MTLKTILLAGVAMCGLAAAPALARSQAPNIHLATSSAGTKMTAHMKSKIHDPSSTNFTETATFTGTISTKADFKVKILLLGETWYSTTSCAAPTKQKWVGLPKKTLYAKVAQSTSTGTVSGCGSTVFTFYDIDYTLTTKKAVGKTDTVSGDLVAKHFEGYNLKLVAHVDLAIAK